MYAKYALYKSLRQNYTLTAQQAKQTIDTVDSLNDYWKRLKEFTENAINSISEAFAELSRKLNDAIQSVLAFETVQKAYSKQPRDNYYNKFMTKDRYYNYIACKKFICRIRRYC